MKNRQSLPCSGPLSRRDFFKFGAMALGGLGLDNLTALRAADREAAKTVPDTSVIFIWLPGGPPHLDTYDMKPDAPAEYRGAFRPIKTNVPGIEVCEHMPLHARVADRYALIRSIAHTFADHGGGHKRFLTGRDPLEPTGFVNDHPMVGSMVAKSREPARAGVPDYIAGVDSGRQGIDTFSFGSAYLGPATHPFTIVGDPSTRDFKVQNLSVDLHVQDRIEGRVRWLKGFDSINRNIDGTGTFQAMAAFHQRDLDLLTTAVARKTFDLS